MRSRNEMMPPADAGPVERPVRPGSAAPHYTVRNCIWNGMAWTDRELLEAAAKAAGMD